MANNDLIGVTIEVPTRHKTNLILRATVEEPEERKCWDIPTQIKIDLFYKGSEQDKLAEILASAFSAGYYGDIAVGVMDSYDQDLGTVGIELFDKLGDVYPVGNIALLDYSGGPYPSDEIFTDEFDMNALVDGIVAVCDVLMLSPQRKADYFVFYGNAEMWPPDKKWKLKFKKSGYHVIDYLNYGAANFIAVREARRQNNDFKAYEHVYAGNQ